jgi:hypothetical protein
VTSDDDSGVTIPAMESSRANRRHIVRALAWQLTLLAGIGLLAIGASGVVALSMRAAIGDRFLAGDAEGITYTAERCADFLEYFPAAADCEAAASGHHADEVVIYRIASGLLGGAALAGWWWLGRRRRWWAEPSLPPPVVPAVGAALFGSAAVVLGGQGLGVMVFEGPSHGPGQWISAGAVSLVVFVGFARAFWRSLATTVP